MLCGIEIDNMRETEREREREQKKKKKKTTMGEKGTKTSREKMEVDY
jgi:hypothetical protein